MAGTYVRAIPRQTWDWGKRCPIDPTIENKSWLVRIKPVVATEPRVSSMKKSEYLAVYILMNLLAEI